MVDAGKISIEDAFDFPDSNIITRSLSDSTPKPNPDCLLMPQKLCDNDIILLCSDGLNGMIRDQEIESIIAANQGNMTECVDALINAALEAAGADNCTVALCQILSGGEKSSNERIPKYSIQNKTNDDSQKSKKNNKIWFYILLILLCLGIGGGWYYCSQGTNEVPVVLSTDSIKTETAVLDSINKAKRDSLERADSISKAVKDSIEKAKSDSINREKTKKELKKKIKETRGEVNNNLPIEDMNEIPNKE